MPGSGYFNDDRISVNNNQEAKVADREGFKGKEPKQEMKGDKKGQLSTKEHFGKSAGKKSSRKSSRR